MIHRRSFFIIVIFHLFLGPVLRFNPTLATIHALSIGVLTIFIVLFNRDKNNMLYLIGYITGSEVLWRMSGSYVFWMYADYLILLIVIIGFLRTDVVRKGIKKALLYGVLLMASIPLLFLGEYNLDVVRQEIAFNLSVPVVFAIGVYAISRFDLDRSVIIKSLFLASLPIISIAAVTTYSVFFMELKYIAVSESSNAAAGGYGANQVSNALSFGAACMTAIIIYPFSTFKKFKIYIIILILYVLSMALLTLSRGGIVNYIFFITGLIFFIVQDRKKRLQVLFLLALIMVFIQVYIFPELDQYTGGAINRRYLDMSTTGRNLLIEDELKGFKENPIIGVGPGMGKKYRMGSASHTEYTRLLVEHGVLGIFAAIMIFLILYQSIARAGNLYDKAIITAFSLWIFVSFAHQATRTVETSFMAMILVSLSFLDGDTDLKLNKINNNEN